MKKLIYILFIVFAFGACDEGFEEMNVDPINPAVSPASTQLTYVQLTTAGNGYVANLFWNIIHLQANMQQTHITSYTNAFAYKPGHMYRLYEEQFTTSIKNVVDLEANMAKSTSATAETDHAITKVWRVLAFSRITDAYGDIPYSEAAKGFIEGIRYPKYDNQEDIYADMLLTLEEASNILSKGEPSSFGGGDIIYGGNTAKWHRFANSLMLRLAMRMTKVDEAKAQEWATKAINAGVMIDNGDIAAITDYVQSAPHGHKNANPNTNGFSSRTNGQIRWSKTFMDYLQSRNDPRIPVLCTLEDGNPDPALQVGKPINETSKGGAYSKPNINIFGSKAYTKFNGEAVDGNAAKVHDAPYFFQTYAEVEFMVAEAAFRWGIGGDAKTHYDAGVRAAMEYLSMYGHGVSVKSDDIDAYLAANPFGSEGELKMINEQYWVATFTNGLETFSNWRRSGYPELVPMDIAGQLTGGEIPRRFVFPNSESTQNTANYEAAYPEGTDVITARVWWDK